MGIKLGQSVKDMIRIVTPSEQIIKPRFDKWLIEHGDDPFPLEIADWVRDQLLKRERARDASFAGSASGMCHRRQIFQYLGIPVYGEISPQLTQIFKDGDWRHLRLQAQIMSAGIIPLGNMEWPLSWPRRRAMGTADGVGIVPDDHPVERWRGQEYILELKGANGFVAQGMMDPEKYIKQVTRYSLVSGIRLVCVFVENKNTQESKEFVTEIKDEWLLEQEQELEALNQYVNDQTLPRILSACQKQTGPLFRDCPYGGAETRPCPNLPVGKVPSLPWPKGSRI